MKLKSIIFLLVIFAALWGVFHFFVDKEEPVEKEEPVYYAWEIDMMDIKYITISLPHEDLGYSFVRIDSGSDFPWHFDDEEKTPVDVDRWGGGIPLILSGPGSKRIISKETSEEKLAEYGLADPQMLINIITDDDYELDIKVGYSTPDAMAYYVQVPSTTSVCIVDYSWYDVLESLITNPPYVSEEAETS